MSEKRRPGQEEERTPPKSGAPNEPEPQFAVGETVDSEVTGKGRGVLPRDLPGTPQERAARTGSGGETQYEVVSDGMTGAGGATYMKGDILTAEQIGDEARVEKLLANGAIKEVE